MKGYADAERNDLQPGDAKTMQIPFSGVSVIHLTPMQVKYTEVNVIQLTPMQFQYAGTGVIQLTPVSGFVWKC